MSPDSKYVRMGEIGRRNSAASRRIPATLSMAASVTSLAMASLGILLYTAGGRAPDRCANDLRREGSHVWRAFVSAVILEDSVVLLIDGQKVSFRIRDRRLVCPYCGALSGSSAAICY